MSVKIGCIVEGHGEVESVPVLVRRIAQDLDPTLAANVSPPIRVPRSKLRKQGELERAVELATRKTGAGGAILVLLDSDDDCPAQLGPELHDRALAARNDMPISVVLAKREFESWFLAAAESLRGVRGLAVTLTAPPDPEAVRGAKEWLDRQMQSGKYSETLDQPALTSQFDLTTARRADSFDRCYREIARLIRAAGR